MRTDTIFYQLFLAFPELIFELLDEWPQEGYQFSSREIKELARRFDGILLPPENKSKKTFGKIKFTKSPGGHRRYLLSSDRRINTISRR